MSSGSSNPSSAKNLDTSKSSIGNVDTKIFTNPTEVPLAIKSDDGKFTLTDQGAIVQRNAKAYGPLVGAVSIESIILALIAIAFIVNMIQKRINRNKSSRN